MDEIISYPLQWPAGVPRSEFPKRGGYRATFEQAVDNIHAALVELVGEAVVATLVVSSDFQGDETTDDPGVVAYFQIEGSLHFLPCDRGFTVAQNAQGIALTLKAMLDIGKHSNPEIAARMLRVLAAAVEPTMRTWRDVLGFPPSLPITPALLRQRYAQRAFECHPDQGGSNDAMSELNTAYQTAKAELSIA